MRLAGQEQKRNRRRTGGEEEKKSERIAHWILQSQSRQRSCHLILLLSINLRPRQSLLEIRISFRGERSGFRACYLVFRLIIVACFRGEAVFDRNFVGGMDRRRP